MNYLIWFCRIIVGVLFIVSGLIKANDPIGFSIKLEEYFAETALNLPSFMPFALILGVIACVSEIILGFALLFGSKMKLASWLLLLLIVFFGWLTLYTATCNPADTFKVIKEGKEVEMNVTCVTDCGCFGDAMKGSIGRSLTPWESFTKDLVLFILLIPIFFRKSQIKLNTVKEDMIALGLSLPVMLFFCWVFSWYFPLLFMLIGFGAYFLLKKVLTPEKCDWPVAGAITAFSAFFAYYCYAHLPVRDYRPYAIGKNLIKQMEVPPGAPVDVYETMLTYKNINTGEKKSFTQDEYMKLKIWEDTLMKWDTSITKLVSQGYKPPIHDFKIMSMDGSTDVTQDVLNNQEYNFLLVAYNINKTNTSSQPKINELANALQKKGVNFIGLTASPYSIVDPFRHEHQNMFDYYSVDETSLKTMIRANPGLVLLKGGTVIDMWHYNDIPTFEEVNNTYLKK